MNYFEMKWRLSACRIQAGYSQAEVAEILGCKLTAPKKAKAKK